MTDWQRWESVVESLRKNDPSAEALYEAEERFYEESCADFDDDLDWCLAPAEVVPFMEGALTAAGYVSRSDGRPIAPPVHFDIPDDDWRAGACRDDGLHFHPEMLRTGVVLHELAHACCPPRELHGPRFCAVLLCLVVAVHGDEAGRRLAWWYSQFGVEVDEQWLPLMAVHAGRVRPRPLDAR